MRGSTKRPLTAALVALAVLAGCSDTGTDDGSTTTTTEPGESAVEDGTWFAFVTVGEDEDGVTTLGIDLAEMLTGEEAKQAAIEDGVIAEGEDLPNDFYIDNDEVVLELVHAAEDARFLMISGEDVAEKVEVDAPLFAEIYQGTYSGTPLYGVVPQTPVAMDVVVAGGLVTEATAVYLP